MIKPAVFQALDCVKHPFSDSYARHRRVDAYTARFQLDEFQRQGDDTQKVLAAAVLRACKDVKPDLQAFTLPSVVAALQTGLPPGPASCTLAAVCQKALQHDDEQSHFGKAISKELSPEICGAVEDLSSSLTSKSWQSTYALPQLYESALEVAANPDLKLTKDQATAWIGHEFLDRQSSAGMTEEYANEILQRMAWSSEPGVVKQAQDAQASIQELASRCHEEMEHEPVHLDYSPALDKLQYATFALSRQALAHIAGLPENPVKPKSSP